MKVDWFTIIAQAINFIILIWLLKRFLYKPILSAIDEREKKISTQLAEAENKKAEAEAEHKEFLRKNEKFDHEKRQLMNKAIAESNEERERFLKEARQDAIALKTKQEEALEEIQNNLNEEYGQNIKREVFSISKKTLSDLASVDLESQTVNIFIKKLNELKEDEKKQFIQSFKSGTKPMIVQSAFELDAGLQNKIKKAVDKILGSETTFDFKVKPDLIIGIEMSANGYSLAWSISEYFNSLKKNVVESEDKKPKTINKKASHAKK